MNAMIHAHDASTGDASHHLATALRRNAIIGLIAFLTVVDLFATQAILPTLARAYDVAPAAMGFAVNASTIGMAVAGLLVAFFSRRIDRRRGIVAQPGTADDPDGPAGDRARSRHLHRAADRPGRLHVGGVHAHPRLSRRAMQRRRRRAVPSPPMSPAMSPATCSAACSRPRSPIISGSPPTSTCSRCST